MAKMSVADDNLLTKYAVKTFLVIPVVICLLLSGCREELRPTRDQRPNILLIYVDDMGYSDVGIYGRRYGNMLTETPNIDKLAAGGMMFLQAYAAAPLCSPSRAALLTGKSPARLNFEFVTKYEDDQYAWDDENWAAHWAGRKLLPPPFTLNLPLEEITIAEALGATGYTTGMAGKWHVAAHHKFYKDWSPTHGPAQQGFAYAKETFGAHPYSYRSTDGLGVFGEFKAGQYPDDSLTNEAISFIRQNHENPFFLFVSHYYVHYPVDTKAEWLIGKYRAKAGEGTTEARIKYAAFVDMADHYIGQLLDALDSADLAKNTLVIFTSDNGGHSEYAFTRPFRGSKCNLYEGGIRVPMIARWPGVVSEQSTTSVPVMQTDLMPTLLEIAGSEGVADGQLDGLSILPVFKDPETPKLDERIMYWHFPYYHPEGSRYEQARVEIGVEDQYISRSSPQSAIQRGDMKLIYFYEDERAELYDLSEDIAEQNNLAAERPDVLNSMKKELFFQLANVGARFPRPNQMNVEAD
jgi:uncharacterized sulfatase